MAIELRDAGPEDAQELSALVLRSKAVHGYDQTFLDACRAELQVTDGRLRSERIRVAHRGLVLLGMSALCFDDTEAELTALFVEPSQLGRGVGHALWLDALEACRERGFQRLHIESDPFATAWYQRQGAVQIGEAPSGSIPGRRLPLLEVRL